MPDSEPVGQRPVLADVILPRHLRRVFTYLVPPRLLSDVKIGSPVRVPFGRVTLEGLVVALGTDPPKPAAAGARAGFQLREIVAVVAPCDQAVLPAELFQLSRLVADHYLAPWGQTLRLFFPPPPVTPGPRYTVTDAGIDALAEPTLGKRLTPAARQLLIRLSQRRTGLADSTLKASDEPLRPMLKRLRRDGFIQLQTSSGAPSAARTARRSSPRGASGTPVPAIPTSDEDVPREDRRWWTDLVRALECAAPRRFLLHGAGRSRLPHLLNAVKVTLAHGRQALIITPHIDAVHRIATACAARWPEQVQALHSGLPARRREEAWHRIRTGGTSIVVGTRAAVFAPLTSLGLLYLDDEEDTAFKEETEPRYHARDVAWMRAHLHQAVLVLASAHPSLESFYTGPAPYGDTPGNSSAAATRVALSVEAQPRVHTIDLRRVPYGALLSEPFVAAMAEALDRRTPIILFQNRKGFAPALVCCDCGQTPSCPRCSVALTFYKKDGRLCCRYCGTSLSLPDTCPTCLAPRLEPRGVGTEAVEERVRSLFPNASVGRVDRGGSSTTTQIAAIRRRFTDGQLDILIGTQMLCHGPSMPPAGFVGIVQADAGLHLPDFRAAEQTFRTLSAAVALAGTGPSSGTVMLQTYLPTHYVIEAIANHDPSRFYEQELACRRALGYPPFGHLISLHVSGPSPDVTRTAAERWAERLKVLAARSDVVVWGPIPAPLARLRNRYRWQIAVKTADGQSARHHVGITLKELEGRTGTRGVKFEVDVDPVTML